MITWFWCRVFEGVLSSVDIGSFSFFTGVDYVSDDGATRLLLDGVGTLGVSSGGYMNRFSHIFLNSFIFSSNFR